MITGRRILFASYGLIVGLAYAATMIGAWPLPDVAILGTLLAAFFGYGGYRLAKENTTAGQLLLLIPVMPLAMLGAIIGMIFFFACFAILWPFLALSALAEGRRFRNRMKAKGRFIDREGLRQRLLAGQGTVIMDMGPHGLCDLWWTEDDLLAKGLPVSTREEIVAVFDGEERAFNTWCWEHYLDVDIGKALLTPFHASYARSRKFSRRFPLVHVVMVVRPVPR